MQSVHTNWLMRSVTGLSLVLVLALRAEATITTTGDVSPVHSGTDPWDIAEGAEWMIIGGEHEGTLAITAESTVRDKSAILGFAPGSFGQAAVTGDASAWEHQEYVVVGAHGEGHLSVTGGGDLLSDWAYVGGCETFIWGSDPWGASVAEGVGTALVSGTGSRWNCSGPLFVGFEGTGSMTIENGAQVNSATGSSIGYNGAGDVTVTGAGSTWNVELNLFVGRADQPEGIGRLAVKDGGRVDVGAQLVIRDAGTLTGDGVVSAISGVQMEGTGRIAPGNSIGTLAIVGDVVFSEGSTLEIETDRMGNSDKLVVNGNVTAAGAVRVTSEETVVGTRRYEIIEADSVTGVPYVLDTSLLDFSFENAGLDYEDAGVFLWIASRPFDDPDVVQTCNQEELGHGLQRIAEAGGNEATNALQRLQDMQEVRRAYDQLSGQSRPPLAPVTIAETSKFLGAAASRVQRLQLAETLDFGLAAMSETESGQAFAVGNGAATLPDRKWGLWGRGYGLYGDRDSENGMPGYSYNASGGSLGLDYQFTKRFLGGIVTGQSEGDMDVSASRDSTDFDATHIGLYGSLTCEGWQADVISTYTDLAYDTERFVDLTDERLVGGFDGREFAAYAEVARTWDLAASLRLAPLASVQYAHLSLDSYTESGGGSALGYEAQTYESVQGSLGARVTRTLIETVGGFQADVQLQGRWAHEFGDDQSTVDTHFIGSPAVIFTVRDEEISRDSAVLGIGGAARLSERVHASVDYDTRLNSDESIQVISAAIQYRW